MPDLELRSRIYRHIVDTGAMPQLAELRLEVDDRDSLETRLRELHDAHMIVLDDRSDRLGEIRMALPFAAEPTNFRVETSGGAWWANCAWDSLAIAAALHQDARISSTWRDTGDTFERNIVDGQLDDVAGLIEFQVPARRWWDNIVET